MGVDIGPTLDEQVDQLRLAMRGGEVQGAQAVGAWSVRIGTKVEEHALRGYPVVIPAKRTCGAHQGGDTATVSLVDICPGLKKKRYSTISMHAYRVNKSVLYDVMITFLIVERKQELHAIEALCSFYSGL